VRPPVTVPLGGVSSDEVGGAVGLKANSLGTLIEAGFPVPEGFVVTSHAWERCVEGSRHWEKIKEFLRKVESLDEGALAEAVSEIRNIIDSLEMDEIVEGDIRRAYFNLGKGNPYVEVIVRGSPVFRENEPAPPSGLYEPHPAVQGYDALLEAIKLTWSGAFNNRALRYLARAGALHRPPKMAAIVQRMVPADVSGALYTQDPATGNPDILVIEAVNGPALKPTPQKHQPEIFRVARVDWQLEERRLTGPRPSGLTEELACALANFGARVQDYMEAPQIIDWCATGGNFHLVGTKPMSGEGHTTGEPNWSRMDWAAELMPAGPMTPFTKSVMMPILEEATHSAMKNAGIRLDDELKLFSDFYGGLRVNSTEMTNHLAQLMNIHPEIVPDSTLEGEARTSRKRKGSIGNLAAVLRAGKAARKVERKNRKALPDVLRRKARLERADLRGKSDAALYLLMEELIKEVIQPLMTARCEFRLCLMLVHSALRDLLESKLPDRAAAVHAALPSPPSGKRLVRDTWKLGRLSESIGGIHKKMLRSDSWEEIRSLASRTEGGELFNRRLNRYLAEYGSCCPGILEFSLYRWKERPGEPAALIAMMANNADISDPATGIKTASSRAAEIRREVSKNLGPTGRTGLNVSLKNAQVAEQAMRRLDKCVAEAASILREMLMETGRRCRVRGETTSENHVFFLRMDEIKKLLSLEQPPRDAQELVAERKEEFKNLGGTRSSGVRTGEMNDKARPPEMSCAGIGVSSGEYTGPACVIRGPDDIPNLRHGQVAVLPGMCACFSPLAGVAGAMVTESGGFVSETGLISRAYGLPCVACVPGACNLIRTGDIITVDGTAGIVKVISSARAGREAF